MTVTKNPSTVSLAQSEGEDFFQRFAPVLVGILVAIVLVLGGYFLFSAYKEKKMEKEAALIYKFQAGPLKDFQDKKMKEEDFLKSWDTLLAEVGDNKKLAFLAMEVAAPFSKEQKWDVSIKTLSTAMERFQGDSFLYYFLGTGLGAAYEDAGKNEEAIKIYENILKKDVKFLEPKVYFDLGRLYARASNKDKAKVNFQYIIDNFPDDKMAHLARISLQNLQ